MRAPALHFLLIGGLLFLVEWGGGVLPEQRGVRERAPIVFSAADVERLRRAWMRQYGEPPSPAEESALVDESIDEAVLLREALAQGVHLRDKAVRARLVQVGRFLGLAGEMDDGALEREAAALGLAKSDTAIRRHLVQMMRLAIAGPRSADVAEADLRQYYEQHAARFTDPPRLSLTHVFVSADRRGTAASQDAEQLLGELIRRGVTPADSGSYGDPFIRGSRLPLTSAAELERIFGSEFAAAVAPLAPQAWSGPVQSTYGFHLVWVHERRTASVPPLDVVRNQVVHAVVEARRDERRRGTLRLLRQRYVIEVARDG